MIQTLNQEHTAREDVILFIISDRRFGLPVDAIKEIIRPLKINKLPLAPFAIEGLIKVRENIYPLVNVEKLLGFNHVEASEDDERFILVQCGDTSVALQVNRVESLTSYPLSDLDQHQSEDSAEIKRYTKGSFSKDGDTFVYLLSLEAITESLLEEARKVTSS